jgi:hypothetical protein
VASAKGKSNLAGCGETIPTSTAVKWWRNWIFIRPGERIIKEGVGLFVRVAMMLVFVILGVCVFAVEPDSGRPIPSPTPWLESAPRLIRSLAHVGCVGLRGYRVTEYGGTG